MEDKICLDTDVLVNFLRGKENEKEYIKRRESSVVLATTFLNLFELYWGAYKSKRAQNIVKVEEYTWGKDNLDEFFNDIIGENEHEEGPFLGSIICVKKTIDSFYSLPVPTGALVIHKKEIELLTIKKAMLEKIIDYEKDPVGTMLASNELKNVDIQFNDLKKQISEFIKNNNLNI